MFLSRSDNLYIYVVNSRTAVTITRVFVITYTVYTTRLLKAGGVQSDSSDKGTCQKYVNFVLKRHIQKTPRKFDKAPAAIMEHFVDT